mgnify:CR=1 FL=1
MDVNQVLRSLWRLRKRLCHRFGGTKCQVSEQVESQQVDSSETTEEVSADSVADTQLDEVQVTLEEEAPNHMPELNLEKEQEKETPKTNQIPLENPYLQT